MEKVMDDFFHGQIGDQQAALGGVKRRCPTHRTGKWGKRCYQPPCTVLLDQPESADRDGA